jgi:hypothetical protein
MWFCKLLPVFNFCIQSFYQLGVPYIGFFYSAVYYRKRLSLNLDMKESKTIIPLYTDNYSVINKSTFLKPFSVIDCTVEEPDIWYPELIEGLNTEIKHWKQLTEPPSLANGKEYHFVVVVIF